jgi:hypothetical protein
MEMKKMMTPVASCSSSTAQREFQAAAAAPSQSNQPSHVVCDVVDEYEAPVCRIVFDETPAQGKEESSSYSSLLDQIIYFIV